MRKSREGPFDPIYTFSYRFECTFDPIYTFGYKFECSSYKISLISLSVSHYKISLSAPLILSTPLVTDLSVVPRVTIEPL